MVLEKNLDGIQHVGIPVTDIQRSIQWYVDTLDFCFTGESRIPTPEGEIKIAFVEKEGLVLEFYQLVGSELQEISTRGHGHIDHLTIDVLNSQLAMEDTLSHGAKLDQTVSPDGPISAPAYWTKGVAYVFILGPQGERIELNERKDLDPLRRKNNLGGWSHLGIPVTDIERSRAFYQQFGFLVTMDISIPAGTDTIRVAMAEKDGFALEFYKLVGTDLEEIRNRGDGHIDHFAMNVKDVESAYQELKSAGFNPLSEGPVDLPVGEHGVRYFFVCGPNGEKIEFNQKLA